MLCGFFEVEAGKTEGDIFGHDAGDIVGREQGGVEAEVVGCGVAPAFVGVKVVVVGAEFVGALAQLFGFGAGVDIGAAHDAVDAVFGRGVHEDVDHRGVVAQDIVGRAPHDDARTVGGKPADNVALRLIDGVARNGGGTLIPRHVVEPH